MRPAPLPSHGPIRSVLVLPPLLALGGLMLAGPATASVHTWDVAEVFSNADGTIQFVELVDAGDTGGEINIGNASITTSLGTISWSNGQVTPPTDGRR